MKVFDFMKKFLCCLAFICALLVRPCAAQEEPADSPFQSFTEDYVFSLRVDFASLARQQALLQIADDNMGITPADALTSLTVLLSGDVNHEPAYIKELTIAEFGTNKPFDREQTHDDYCVVLHGTFDPVSFDKSFGGPTASGQKVAGVALHPLPRRENSFVAMPDESTLLVCSGEIRMTDMVAGALSGPSTFPLVPAAESVLISHSVFFRLRVPPTQRAQFQTAILAHARIWQHLPALDQALSESPSLNAVTVGLSGPLRLEVESDFDFVSPEASRRAARALDFFCRQTTTNLRQMAKHNPVIEPARSILEAIQVAGMESRCRMRMSLTAEMVEYLFPAETAEEALARRAE